MEIILWRHAQAHEEAPDEARRLTELGHEQAQRMANWLKQRLAPSHQVWTSEARRTQQTAAYLSPAALPMRALNPEARYQDILHLISRQPLDASLVLVGHQPWLGHLCHCLLNRTDTSVQLYPVSKGVMWWFQIDATEPQLRSRLKAMMPPDLA
ncbi:MAG: histidine phosphatase family protein [Neisseriaceae bacterium]|nr:histidine phosphatase family protein [Neisseriaceae bacterium]